MAAARVQVSANFDTNLEAIKIFLEANETIEVFPGLLDLLFDRLIPNLEAHPRMGRDLLARAPGSVEGKLMRQRLIKKLNHLELREYIMDDYIVLYALGGTVVTLLAIKHHRQLSFDLPRFLV